MPALTNDSLKGGEINKHRGGIYKGLEPRMVVPIVRRYGHLFAEDGVNISYHPTLWPFFQ